MHANMNVHSCALNDMLALTPSKHSSSILAPKLNDQFVGDIVRALHKEIHHENLELHRTAKHTMLQTTTELPVTPCQGRTATEAGRPACSRRAARCVSPYVDPYKIRKSSASPSPDANYSSSPSAAAPGGFSLPKVLSWMISRYLVVRCLQLT